MKFILKIGAYLLLLVSVSCASGKDKATPEEIAAFDKMISDQRFEIRPTWAQPMASQGLTVGPLGVPALVSGDSKTKARKRTQNPKTAGLWSRS